MASQDCTEEKPATWYKCSQCGHTFQGEEIPEQCPSCNEKCTFANVTCYTPDCNCNGPDPKLM